MKNGILIVMSVLVLVGSSAAAWELGERYIDPVNGFSLCPLAEAELNQSGALPSTVKWVMREAQTQAIEYTIVASCVKGEDAAFNDLLVRLKKQGLDVALRQDGEKRQIDFSGEMRSGDARFYQKGMMVPAGSDTVSLTVLGAMSKQQQVQQIFALVASTFQAADPRKNIDQAKRNLENGEKLLANLPAEDIEKKLPAARRFYLYTRQGKTTGYMIADEQVASRSANDSSGLGIGCEFQIRIDSPGSSVKINREMFSSLDRSVETWSEKIDLSSSPKEISISQTGRKHEDSLEVEFVKAGKKSKNPLIKLPSRSYLPKAMEMLVYRLIADKPAGSQYAFAVYDSTKNQFNLRTFIVVGPEQIEIGGQSIDAIKLTDQVNINKSPADVWVDANGDILRLEAGGGLVMEKSNEEAVKAAFPDALME